VSSLTDQLQALARLLEYPTGQDYTALAPALAALSPEQREELYTATFDVTPACVPYVSIHLFGEENFKRAEFMAALLGRYRQAGFETCDELPDHVSVLLRFLAQTDEAERRELIQFCLLGPLGKMVAALAVENPFRALLEAVSRMLHAAYPGLEPAMSPLEQMRQHGAACAEVSSSCSCGAIMDGTADPSPSPVGALPIKTNALRSANTPGVFGGGAPETLS
jgi:nitrate reductase delta subunit